jgi:serine/threonine-protein kinase
MEKDRSKRRYKPGQQIGAGDFATVFAARDLKLNRDVAIKQLHPQFLKDPGQLERYWQEAQLLGSIQHPNIMTIYDVVKSKGCLILEQMQGSLQAIYGQNPMPVAEVRQSILQVAQGLKCLHENGIVHGDIKPGNLFLSRQDVVKLGDFGLARRVNDDNGSLVKGTTRYMAPELVSEEFGDVGSPSDLYSLGFSALEMMVGPQFESLFPDLIAFGRDRQMAWMMWHCSADRKLPPVQSLLAGVPDDLAHVIQKLTAKDQKVRYRSADEVIADLSGYTAPVGNSLKQEALEKERLAKLRKKKRLRLAAICLSSLLVTGGVVAYAFWPKPPVVEREAPPSIRGVVQNVLPLDQKLVLDIGTDWKEFSLRADDAVTLNRKERQLRDLENGDRVVVHSRLAPENKIRYDIVAFRPETHTGVIGSVNAEEGKFLLRVTEGEEAGAEFLLAAPEGTPIELNAKTDLAGETYTVNSLAEGDRVVVKLSDDEDGMLALSVEALRETTLEGFARKIDVRNRMITIALDESQQDAAKFVRIPLEPNCIVKLNDYASLNDQLVRVADLLPGDQVTLTHDLKVKTIDAFRVFHDSGPVVSTSVSGRTITIRGESGSNQTYTLGQELPIRLGTETVALDELRAGDQIKISHVFPGQANPNLKTLSAERPSNPKRWAILIANGNFADPNIKPLAGSLPSGKAIRDQMVMRYAIPTNQAFLCDDFSTVRLKEEFPRWVKQVPKGAELYVYVTTRAFSIENQNVFLATQDANRKEIDESGIALNWIIDQLDGCATTEKVLMLDCTHPDSIKANGEVSSEKMIEIARSTHRGGYPKSVYVLGSTRKDQTGTESAGTSTFAASVAKGFRGAADQVGDNQLEITELADYVQKSFSGQAGSQTPIFFLPDPSPPRISARSKADIVDFLGLFGERKIDMEKVEAQFAQTNRSAPGQPEPAMAYALMLMKDSKMDKASAVLDKVRLSHPAFLPAQKTAIWLNFYKVRYSDGINKLQSLLEQIPPPDEVENGYSERTLEVFEWAGRLREIADRADWTERVPAKAKIAAIDLSLKSFGDEPGKRFAAGREHVRNVIAGFDKDLEVDPESMSKLKKRRIRSYMNGIANEALIEEIVEGLDK